MNSVEKYLQSVLSFSEKLNACYLAKYSTLDVLKIGNIQELICNFSKSRALELLAEIDNNYNQITLENISAYKRLQDIARKCFLFLEGDLKHAEELDIGALNKEQIVAFTFNNIERLKELTTLLEKNIAGYISG